jgi:hypothetical protein
MYDPALGRMLSPDNYVQASNNAQNYNRYSYCLNNPLKYTDPSGNSAILSSAIVGAYIFTTVNGMTGKINSNKDFYFSMAIGAASGAAGAGASQFAGGFIGSIGFLGGSITGTVGGFAGGFFSGFGSAYMNGTDLIAGGLKARIVGAITGGLAGGFAGGVYSARHKGNFWTGKGATFKVPSFSIHSESSPVEYNKSSAIDFADEYLIKTDGLNELYVDDSVPFGYEFNEITGTAVDLSNGVHADGLTTYRGIFSGKSDMYLYPHAFTSKEKLYLVMQHEYIHVGLYNRRLDNDVYQEASATIFTYEQGVKWDYDMSKLYNDYGYYKNLRIPKKYHYSRFGIQILDKTPW